MGSELAPSNFLHPLPYTARFEEVYLPLCSKKYFVFAQVEQGEWKLTRS
jgi:hypothetical protein